jgi:hypothetical protein
MLTGRRRRRRQLVDGAAIVARPAASRGRAGRLQVRCIPEASNEDRLECSFARGVKGAVLLCCARGCVRRDWCVRQQPHRREQVLLDEDPMLKLGGLV